MSTYSLNFFFRKLNFCPRLARQLQTFWIPLATIQANLAPLRSVLRECASISVCSKCHPSGNQVAAEVQP